jgi:O-antigen ligase
LAIGVLILFVLKKRYKVLLVVFFLLFTTLFLFADTKIEGLNPFRTVSTNNRILSLREAFYITERSNFLGVGFNAFRDAQIRFDTRNKIGALQSNADAGTDNSLVFVLATTGIVGFAFFVLSYLWLFRSLYRSASSNKLFIICIICSLWASSFFINTLFYIPIVSFVFLLLGFKERIS